MDLITLVVIAVAALIGWLLRGSSAKLADSRIETELRGQLADRDQKLVTLEVSARDASEKRARAEADSDAMRTQLQANQLNFDKRLEDQAAHFQRQHLDAKEAHERALSELKESFKALSADALKENAPAFLALANENLGKQHAEAKGDLETRKKEIEALLKPLQQQLTGYQELSQQSQKSIGEVVQQLTDIRKTSEVLAGETQRFRMVLSSNQARGKWGEETLRRVVEAAGMSAHCDFDVQVSQDDARPDMIVRLPEGKTIIVDAKVPDLDFITALGTSEPDKRGELLKQHAKKLQQTIKDLASRNYPQTFAGSLDYVVLFLPAESLFSAALEGDQDLIVWAAQQRIMIATPASLIALLRSVSISWQQYAQTENTQLIAETAKELYQRVATFYEHFESIGDAVGKAAKAFNRAVGSYDSRVRPTGDRLLELKVDNAGKQLPVIDPIDDTLRLPKS